MIQIFDTLAEYNIYTSNDENLNSGVLYYVKEDGSGHFFTNNIDGENKLYDLGSGGSSDDDCIIAVFRKIDYQGADAIIGMYVADYLDEIEIDGVKQETIESYVTLPQGNHVIKYKLKNNTILPENMFSGCSDIISATLPASITTIAATAFSNCSNLTAININNNLGGNITYIGYDAFYYCKLLASIILESTTPPTVPDEIFNDSYVPKIYVPAASVDAYKAASGWSDYADYIFPIPE